MTEQEKEISANKHILDFLKYYVELPQSPNYALMLSGDWGIGKTHLIDKFLANHFTKSQQHIYVSLYGLTSSEQISDAIFRKRFPIVEHKGVKIAGAIAQRDGPQKLDRVLRWDSRF